MILNRDEKRSKGEHQENRELKKTTKDTVLMRHGDGEQ